MNVEEYPEYICRTCGEEHGKHPSPLDATWHLGVCQLCHTDGPVTQPRDFGHLRASWQQA